MTAVKTLLPIRAERIDFRGYPQIVLRYEGKINGVMQPFTHFVGPPLDEPGHYHREPLGVAVLQIMQLFWKMENDIGNILKERDAARAEADGLVEEVKELTSRCHGLEGKLAQLTNRAAKKG